MSDAQKDLRQCAYAIGQSYPVTAGVCRQAADYIDTLEARIAELEAQKTRSQEHYIKLLGKAEAENQRLRDALRSIAANTCCDRCQEAALVAKAALLGGGDE